MENHKKKILLINPIIKYRKGFSVGRGTQAPLGLGIIAALTPEEFEVEILDEVHDDFELKNADLVGLTSFTFNIPRAYEIASMYREKGVPVVLGGIHASMMPDEALQYVDAVVIGEAESVWNILLSDFLNKKLKQKYYGEYLDMSNSPHPRLDLFSSKYQSATVQTTRGCPMDCDFCSVTLFNGRKYRERPIDQVLDEIEKNDKYPQLFFVDDHIVNNSKNAQKRAISLFKGMVERGIQKPWFGQGSLNIVDNDEVLKWANKSGCYMILTGFESEKTDGLETIGKRRNLKRGVKFYEQVIKKMHKHHIATLGAFIFGLDSDTEQDIIDRYKYIKNSRVDVMQLSILTPLPGTRVYKKAVDEGRLLKNKFPDDWKYYHFVEVTMKPKNIEPIRLRELMRMINRDLFCKENLRKRMFRTLWYTKSFTAAYQSYAYNCTYGRMGLEDEIYDDTKEGLNFNLEWKNRPRSKYLNRTDWIIVIFYHTFWRRYHYKAAK